MLGHARSLSSGKVYNGGIRGSTPGSPNSMANNSVIRFFRFGMRFDGFLLVGFADKKVGTN